MRRVDVEAHSVRDEMVLYCPQRESAFALNKSSRKIWNMCDGRHSVSGIAQALAAPLGIDDDDLAHEMTADVLRTLTEFRSNGLLATSEAPPPESA
jgi:hypothetical protein